MILCRRPSPRSRFLAPFFRTLLGVMGGVFLLGGCAQTQLLVHATKKLQTKEIRPEGVYKVGKPYEVNGVWYYPRVNYEYNETGIASWYGPNFHGKLTANGEYFDMNEVTAAHKTLPLPSKARVTNLENGRSIIVRINDRGPFVNGRILDASRKSAQLLGFEKKGTAKVQVEILADESRMMAFKASPSQVSQGKVEEIKVAAAPQEAVTSEALPPPPGTMSDALPEDRGVTITAHSAGDAAAPPAQAEVTPKQPEETEITYATVKPTQIYIQAGAFANLKNAYKLQERLAAIGQAQISQTWVEARPFYRIRFGPLESVKKADDLLDSIINAGYKDARLILVK